MSDTERDSSTFGIAKIPTLTGTDNFIIWKRAITNYLRQKGALRVLEGREVEPYRNPNVAKPANQVAGDVPPGDADANDQDGIVTSITNADLDEDELTIWNAWERKESKARAAILMTISHGIASDIKGLWCAHDMYERICDKHRIDSTERRADLAHRIQLMRLPLNATREQMLKHYESFTTILAEASNANMRIEEWDKCERFIFTLPKDLETLRIQWRILAKDRQTWRELVALYKIIADKRGLTVDREAMVNAIFHPNKGKGGGNGGNKGQKGQGNGNGGNGNNGGGSNGGKGKGNGGNNNKGKGDSDKKSDKLCDYCGYRNHVEADCRRKKSGEPSAKDIKAALQRIKDEKSKPASAQVAQASTNADIFGSVHATAYIEEINENPAGSVNATIFMASHSDDEFLIDSGASHHIVPNSDGLVNITNLSKPLRFNLAGSSMEIVAHQKGMLGITLSSGKSFGIRNIYIVRQARMRIFSTLR